jgi:hypothetical protein
MNSTKELLYTTIDMLNDEEIIKVLEFTQSLNIEKKDSLTLKRLASNPAFHVPQILGNFSKVEPIHGEGLPASELLVEDRR